MTVKRKWYKGKRLIYSGKRKVLCAECPCGCRYTYYVDHSRSESGDGHSWETAFNSVNDVFYSYEIRTYRLDGCTIYVKIKGNITYIITGTYRYNSDYTTYVILQPENENSRVTVTTDNLYQGTANFIVFDRFDITFTGGGSISSRNLKFLSCSITTSYDRSRNTGSKLSFYGNNLVIYGCTIYCEIINGLNYSYTFSYAGVFSYVLGLDIKNSSISVSMDGSSRGMFDGCRVIDCDRDTMLEDTIINIHIAFENTYNSYEQIVAYQLASASNVVIKSCSSTRDIVISSENYSFCRFSSLNNFSGVTFYDCEQDYYESSPAPPDGFPCQELS